MVHGQEKLAVPMGGTAVVIGDGVIGLLHAQLLRHRGAAVILVGSRRHRMILAETLGINTVLSRHDDVKSAVLDLTAGRGADIVVNAAGGPYPLTQALDVAARRGQILFFSATLEDTLSLDVDTIHYKELQLIGSYDANIAQYEAALALIQADTVQVAKLISHRFPLNQVTEGYEIARKGEGVKVQIVHE